MAGGTIKNTIHTDYKSTGVKKGIKETESMGRAQTRLGQASASSGRQFSSQASGLGGLVGAYAVAAANVFALQQAFSALNRAVQAQQILDGLNALSAGFGLVGGEILSNIQAITKGQLNFAEAAQAANLAISAGLGQEQLEGLTEVSLKASRALGRSLPDALNRVVRGTAKLEPELLDELGIFARIEPAAEAYALATGKVASSLTNFEKRQAFANAVLLEGQRKFAAVNTTSETAAESLEKLATTLADIGLEIGGLIGDVLAPFASFISNNVSAAIIAIGLLMRQIFGKGATIAAEGFNSFTGKMLAGLESLTAKAASTSEAYKSTFKGIQSQAQNVVPSKLFGGKGAAAGKDVISRLRGGETFSPDAAKEAAAEIEKLRVLNAKSSTQNKKQQVENAKNLRGIQKELELVGTKASRMGKIYNGVLKGMTAATNFLRMAVSKLMKAFNIIFIALAIFETAAMLLKTIFDIDFSPLEALGSWIKELRAESKNTKDAVAGMVNAFSSENLSNAVMSMESMSAAQKELGAVISNATTEQSWSDYFDAPTGTGWLVDSILHPMEDIKTLVAGGISLFSEDAAEKYKKAIVDISDVTVARRRTIATTNILNKEVEKLRETVKKGGEEGQKAFVKLQAIEKVIPFIQAFGADSVKAIGALASITGLASSQFVELAKSGTLASSGANGMSASFRGAVINIANVRGELNDTTKLVDAALLSATALGDEFVRAFANGTATAESAGKAVLAVERNIARAEKEIQNIFDYKKVNDEILKRIDNGRAYIKELEKEVKRLNSVKEELVAIEKIQKAIKSMVSGDIKKFESGVTSGMIGSGGIAKDKTDQLRNQLNFQLAILETQETALNNTKLQRKDAEKTLEQLEHKLYMDNSAIENGKRIGESEERIAERVATRTKTEQAYNKQKRKTMEIDSDVATKEKIISDLLKARLGSVMKVNEELHKQSLAIEKQTKAYKNQLGVLNKQYAVAALARKLAEQKAQDDLTNAQADSRIKIADATLAIEKDFINVLKEQEKFQDRLLQKKKDELAAQQKLKKIQSDINLTNIGRDFDAKIAGAQDTLGDQAAFGNLYTRQQKGDAQRELIALEFQKGMALLEEKKRIAEEEYNNQLSILNMEKDRAATRVSEIDTRIKAERAIQDTELQLFAAKKQQEEAVIQQQINASIAQKENAKLVKEQTFAQINLQEQARKDQIAAAQRRLDLIKLESDANWAYLNARKKSVKDEIAAINALLESQGKKGITITDIKASADPGRFDKVQGALANQADASSKLAVRARIEANAVMRSQERLSDLSRRKLEHELKTTQELAALEGRLLIQKQIAASAATQEEKLKAEERVTQFGRQIEELNKNKELTDTKFKAEEEGIKRTAKGRLTQLEREEDMIRGFIDDVAGVVGGKLKEGVRSFFTAIREGNLTLESFKEGFKNMLVGMIEGIQEKITERFIDPFIDDMMASLFGGDEKKKPMGTALDPLYVKVAGGGIGLGTSGAAFKALGDEGTKIPGNEVADIMAANADFPGMTGITDEMDDFNAAGVSTIDEFGVSMTDFGNTGVKSIGTIGSSFSNFADSATNALFSMNGLAMGIGGAIGGAIGGPGGAIVGAIAGPLVKAGVSALFGSSGLGFFASGGIVRHMAAGGMQRDRVPAMLEPGEFVMKRSAVKNAGAANLAAMNAGSSSGTPNIEVIVNNEGTPKDAQANVKPQLDINKMVVEIVTRDIRNNGPIRKTLRSS